MNSPQITIDKAKLKFNYNDILFGVDGAILNRAKALFRANKVKIEHSDARGVGGSVMGTEKYHISVAYKGFDYGSCDCYIGLNKEELCKHMLAMALAILHQAGDINHKAEPLNPLKLNDDGELKNLIQTGYRKIISYSGPSSAWFSYQSKLDEAAAMITMACKNIKPSVENIKMLWGYVLKISKKLARGGVDDSNGTIGGAVAEIVDTVASMANSDAKLLELATKFCSDKTEFEFEKDLGRSIKIQ